jgi:proteasome lid subunit RPN8/RPN11
MPACAFRFVLQLDDERGDRLGQAPFDPDWLPAVEHARFCAIRSRRLPATTPTPPARIEPVWHTDDGPPTVACVRLLLLDAGPECRTEIPLDYFRAQAQIASRQLVDRGLLRIGDVFRYRVCAFPAPGRDRGTGDDPHATGLEVRDLPSPLHISDTPVEPYLDRSLLVGDDDPEDPPVFLPQRLLEEAQGLVRETIDTETGGILIGQLHRDTVDRAMVFVELTALVPARHADRQAMKLTFTPRTWSDARAALALRGRREAIVGWWHSHPDWCKDCDPQRQVRCPLRTVFFSSDDVALHRTVFPGAHQLGLLLSVRAARIIPALFGWRRGVVTHRGYHLTGERAAPEAPGPAQAATVGGNEHAPSSDS